MTDCPHYRLTQKGSLACSLLAPRLCAGPGNPNHPCPRCQSHWVDGLPPAAIADNPALAEIAARLPPGLPHQKSVATLPSPPPSVSRGVCFHLGLPIAPIAGQRPCKQPRQCILLDKPVLRCRDCESCPHFEEV